MSNSGVNLRNYHQVLRFCQLMHYVHGRLNSFIMMDTSLLSFESFAGDLLLKSSLYFNTGDLLLKSSLYFNTFGRF